MVFISEVKMTKPYQPHLDQDVHILLIDDSGGKYTFYSHLPIVWIGKIVILIILITE